GRNYLGDTWLWDGTTSQWTQAAPAHHPTPVTGPMLFPDPNGRVDLFGGFDGHFYQLTMWQWSRSDWRRLSPATVPYARSSAAVATNPIIDQVVLFGGLGDVNPNNTWTYGGNTWTLQSPVTQLPLVFASSAAFDPCISSVSLFKTNTLNEVAFYLQPHLRGERVGLHPMSLGDWDELFAVALDSLIWEQHPESDRYNEDVFRIFFSDALESGGAFVVTDTKTH